MTFFTAPSAPYENLEPEMSETKENDPTKDDNAAEESRPVAPTDHTSEDFTQGSARNLQEAHTTIKKKSFWNRVKRIITRSVAL